MQITYHKNYTKAFNKLSKKQRENVVNTVLLFSQNPFNPQLHNHPLKSKLQGLHSVSAGGDLRLLFRIVGNYDLVEFILVGTHNQVY